MNPRVSLTTVLREWGRIGCLGFGGPPVHITMLRELCVKQRGWIDDEQFEHGITATGLLPGPSSTQLAIYCAWVIAGIRGAIVGGLAFILPGLVMIIGLAALMLGDSPAWIKGAGAGAAAAVMAMVRAVAGLKSGLSPLACARHRQALVYGLSESGGVGGTVLRATEGETSP